MDDKVSMNRLLDGLPVQSEKLSRDNENFLARIIKMHATGKNRAKAIDTLVLHHMRDAFFYARRCCRASMSDDDIYSACYTALSRSAVNFEADRQSYFAFSKPYIRGQLAREWRKRDTVKHASEHYAEVDSTDDLKPIVDDSVEPEIDVINARDRWRMIEPLLSRLDDREQQILRLHYREDLNFVEIAKRRKVTRAAIQSAHARALRKIRNWLQGRGQLYTE